MKILLYILILALSLCIALYFIELSKEQPKYVYMFTYMHNEDTISFNMVNDSTVYVFGVWHSDQEELKYVFEGNQPKRTKGYENRFGQKFLIRRELR
jgi:hypothetical protein